MSSAHPGAESGRAFASQSVPGLGGSAYAVLCADQLQLECQDPVLLQNARGQLTQHDAIGAAAASAGT